MQYKRIKTSVEVWRAIKAAHPDLVVVSTFSAPDGDPYGNPSEGRMFTEYGFQKADCPLMGADTRWDIDRDNPLNRNNLREEFWLCTPEKDDEY